MGTGFTEYEESLIQAICSLYIQTRTYKQGVFIGMIPKNVRYDIERYLYDGVIKYRERCLS